MYRLVKINSWPVWNSHCSLFTINTKYFTRVIITFYSILFVLLQLKLALLINYLNLIKLIFSVLPIIKATGWYVIGLMVLLVYTWPLIKKLLKRWQTRCFEKEYKEKYIKSK